MLKQSFCLFLVYLVWFGSLAPFVGAQNVAAKIAASSATEKTGLQFRLRTRGAPLRKNIASSLTPAQDLSQAETERILRRLPEIKSENADESAFVQKQNFAPPPKTGNVVAAKFPSDEQSKPPRAANANPATLEVVRFAPEGAVPVAPDLSVTFSQPMVAVTSQETAAQTVPVRLSPEVKGRWRWLGTKTLTFDADTRFPMATRFTATVPAKTKSINGAVLPENVVWTFSTAPAEVTLFSPAAGETVRRDSILLAAFNQEIEPQAVLQKISATAGAQKIKLRLASAAEIAADTNVSQKIKDLQPKRRIALRAAELLPPDATINVRFESGLPSAEGDLTTNAAQDFKFKTFGALEFIQASCGYSDNKNECESHEYWRIEFNNKLDAKSFDKSQIQISPAVENAEFDVYDNEIRIDGLKKPRANYKVVISKDLRDEFGQTLGADAAAEFKIKPDEPMLYDDRRDKNLVVLDPFAKPIYSVYSNNYPNLKVKLYAVKPEDYAGFEAFQADENAKLPTFGRLVVDKTINTVSDLDETIETRIDVAPALNGDFGHAILIVEPPAMTKKNANQRIVKWLSATRIGVDAFADYEQLTVFASDLRTGRALGDAQLRLAETTAAIKTKPDGVAILKLPAARQKADRVLVVSRGADSAILPESDAFQSYYRDAGETGWTRRVPPGGLRWFVFDDRNLYRPGETVSIKGYARKITGGKFADIAEIAGAANSLNYVLKDSRSSEIHKGAINLNSFGAFDLRLKLPENINLGDADLELTANTALQNRVFTHNFDVQEFRRPEFEVSAETETSAPRFVGETATVAVAAKYFAGGALANAETAWTVSSEATDYTPPNRADFAFGKSLPWWRSSYDYNRGEHNRQKFKGATDIEGKHRLDVDFTNANPARPHTVHVAARVSDVNRQTFSAETEFLVHPARLYVGIRAARNFVGANENFKIETITTGIDGNAIANAAVSVVAEQKTWRRIEGSWQQVTVDTQRCETESQTEAVACEFAAKQAGDFTITARVADERGRPNESELQVWTSGNNKSDAPREVEQETVELIPDKKDYAPGDTAEILVNAPFFPAEAVLTLRRNGVVKTERFTMNSASTVLRVPIEDRFLPNIHASVDLVGAAARVMYDDERDARLPKRPAFAGGEINLPISTASRRLNVVAEPAAKTLAPGAATAININVKDAWGNPVQNAEVAVVAVDEAVLALNDYKIPDPLNVFYTEIDADTTDYHSRANVVLQKPEDLNVGFGSGYRNGGGGGGGDGGGANFYLRKDFNALAVFAPSVVTDARGKAVVKMKLPDNPTRYRITAVAATKSKQFGKGESNLTAKQPLIVRPSAPRFMNFGDRIEFPVVVQNQTDNPLTVNVALRAANATLSGANGKQIVVAANDRAEVRFPVAAEKSGIARFQIAATAPNFADAAEIALPVLTPATSEAFATYGTIDKSQTIAQAVEAPRDVFDEFGGLEITTSSTQLQELTDAFIYLQNYPFECSEQIASRVLSVAALRDVLTAFDAKDLPPESEIAAKMKADIERLQKLQHPDGGWSFWRSDDASFPFVSVHVAHALARAKAKGYNVPPEVLAKSREYLKNIEIKSFVSNSAQTKLALPAYALYARDLLGEKDAAKARKIVEDAAPENLSPETIGWLLPVLANDLDSAQTIEKLKRQLLNRATETAGAAHFVTNYADGEYVLLSSDRRADAVVLEALLEVAPDSDLIAKIVRGLLANKTKGRWANTQENVFVLLALDRYFEVYEKQTPAFVACIWLGNSFAGEQKFAERSINSNLINVPMNNLNQQASQNVILDKAGAGRLYYRIGLKYAPKELRLAAADYGFAVARTYEAIDDAGDVRQNPDGSWTIRAGARVSVKLQIIAPTHRYHVALVDNLPAGLEIINAALANHKDLPPPAANAASFDDFWRAHWFEHQNLRDDRAEAFQSLLRAGVWTYTYAARATTPGKFVAPPAKAEEMYQPETFGRSKTDFVVIE